MQPVGENPAGELAQAVVKPVDCLDGGGRVEKRRVGKRTLGDVHEHAQPAGDVLIEGALEAERDASQHRSLVELSWLACAP
jgi:hypothetical protein